MAKVFLTIERHNFEQFWDPNFSYSAYAGASCFTRVTLDRLKAARDHFYLQPDVM